MARDGRGKTPRWRLVVDASVAIAECDRHGLERLVRYCCGVLAPNAKLRKAVTATAGPAGAVLQGNP